MATNRKPSMLRVILALATVFLLGLITGRAMEGPLVDVAVGGRGGDYIAKQVVVK